MPRVSIIIPVYNSEKFIRETILSVLSQNYHDYEIIVVDDGSIDNSSSILHSFGDKIKYFYQENQGLSCSRNFALHQAQGEFIAFLDQDDLWLPDKLRMQVSFLESHKEAAMVFTDSHIINEKGIIQGRLFRGLNIPQGHIFEQLFLFDFIPLLSVLIRKTIFEQVGEFAPHLGIAEDYDLFLRVSKKYPVYLINFPLAKYRIHSSNASRDTEKAAREVLSVVKNIYEENTELLGKKLRYKAKKRIARVYSNLGLAVLWKNNKKEAIENFRRALTYDKKSCYVYLYLFISHLPFINSKSAASTIKLLIKSWLYLKRRGKLNHDV